MERENFLNDGPPPFGGGICDNEKNISKTTSFLTRGVSAGVTALSKVKGDSEIEPRKTAIALTAFLACLSFLIIFSNGIISFLLKLSENEKLWSKIVMMSMAIKNETEFIDDKNE